MKRNYYASKFWRYLAYSGTVLALILLIVIVVSGGSASAILVPGVIMLAMSFGYSRPRFVLTDDALMIRPTVLGKETEYPLEEIVLVDNNDKRFQVTFKNGTVLIFPRYEFSKETRKQLQEDVSRAIRTQPS